MHLAPACSHSTQFSQRIHGIQGAGSYESGLRAVPAADFCWVAVFVDVEAVLAEARVANGTLFTGGGARARGRRLASEVVVAEASFTELRSGALVLRLLVRAMDLAVEPDR